MPFSQLVEIYFYEMCHCTEDTSAYVNLWQAVLNLQHNATNKLTCCKPWKGINTVEYEFWQCHRHSVCEATSFSWTVLSKRYLKSAG